MKRSDNLKNRTGVVFLLIFIGLAAGVLAGGFFAYRNFEQNFRADAERQLSAIAELKVTQLVEYRKERIGDAYTFFQNPAFSNLVKEFFGRTNNGNARRQLQLWLAKYQAQYSYNAMVLLDSHGSARISVPEKTVPIASATEKTAMENLRGGGVVVLDFYRNEHDQKIYMALLVPIVDDTDPGRPLGVLLLRIDPELYLYPFIQTWPLSSRTSETLIIRREGNDALFLNDLRFQKNTALNLKIPLGNASVAAVKAVLGHEGIIEAVDYRGEPVIADVRKVPDSPWFMVCRMDKSEIYEPLQSRLWMMIIVVGALITAAGASVGLVWRHQRNIFYREQFKSAEAMLESESRYRRLFEAAKDGILILDGETGTIVDVNPFLTEILGYPRDMFIDRALWEIGLFKDIAASKERFLELQQKSYVRYEDLPLATADGHVIDVEFVSNVYSMDHHKIIQCNIRDVTERKRAEDALRLSEERYRSLFENMLEGYAYCEMLFDNDEPKDFIYLGVNKSFERLTGLKEVVGRKVSDVIPGIRESNPELLRIYGKVSMSGMPEIFESYVEPLQIWFSVTVYSPKRGSFVAIFSNITERKQSEAERRKLYEESERSRSALLNILEDQKRVEVALRDSQSLYLSFIEQLPNAVFRKDREGRYVLVNPHFCRLKGLKEADFIGKTPLEVASGQMVRQGAEGQAIKYADVGEDVHKEILSTGQTYDAEEDYPGTDGGTLRMYVVRMPVFDSRGAIIGSQGIMFDVSERMRAEEAIQKLNAELESRVVERTAQLEEANKELEAFSYSVSHDLRAPLRSIDGFSQALLEDFHDKLDAQGRSHLERVRNAAQRMGQLIDEVLELSRIQRAELTRVVIDLTTMVIEIIGDLARQQPRSHVQMIIEPGMSAIGDPQLLRICLQNLLENAWKFTSKHGQSRIEFGSTEIDGKRVFFVKDDGAGFDTKHADMLFAPFQRLHSQAEFPGTGVGLASVQRIVHRHGGKIWAESEVEKGATFYFTL